MKVKAYAKINLSLDITGKKEGMHTLKSIMHSVSFYDLVEADISDKISVGFYGADGRTINDIPADNTAYKAAMAVKRETGKDFKVTIVKGIPVAGGLGGSSVDAAAVLRIAGEMLGKDFSFLAPEIGSDVTFMMKGGCCLVEGTGEKITELNPLPGNIIIINAGSVSTGKCYALFDKLNSPSGRGSDSLEECIRCGMIDEKYCRNDLLLPASVINGNITIALDMLKSMGAEGHLSGSGGCIYVLNPGEELLHNLSKKKTDFAEACLMPYGMEFV